MPIVTKVIDRKIGVAIGQIPRGMDEFAVVVGFLDSTNERSDSPMGNATLAYIHENGSPAANIPARPFLARGVDSVRDAIAAVLRDAARQSLAGDAGAVHRGLQRAGIVAAGGVQQYMASGTFAPLAPSTIRRKGSSRPLIDTGQLRQSVTYAVRPKGSIKQRVAAAPKGRRAQARTGTTQNERARQALRSRGIDPNAEIRQDDIGF
jgi:hypothetical protein